MYVMNVAGETMAELKANLHTASQSISTPATSSPAATTEVAQASEPAPAAKPKKTKKEKLAEAQAQMKDEDKETVEAFDEEATAAGEMLEAPAEVSKEQVLENLQKVSKLKGFTFAQGILKKYGKNRISDIPKEKWVDVLDECAKAIA